MFIPLLPLLLLLLPFLPFTLSSPSPALISTDHAISLIPLHTLFLRQSTDLQTFSSALGGARASPITNSGDPKRPFSVDGNTFDSFASAGQRSCDVQFKGCGDVANGKGGQKSGGSAGGSGNANASVSGKKGKKRQSGSGSGGGGGLTVAQCDDQRTQCNSAQSSAAVKDFQTAVASTNIGPDPAFPEFDLICEG